MSVKLQVYKADGTSAKEIDAPKSFGLAVNEHLLYEGVKCYLANQRQGTSRTKTRAEVSGGGTKPWRQKGTGRARSGSNTSPVWVRGSKAHGPKPRDYTTSLNRKARRKALYMALSLRAQEGNVKVFEAVTIDEAKTRKIVDLLAKVGDQSMKSLLVLDENDPKIVKAGRNLKDLQVKLARDLNVYDVLNNHRVLITEKSLTQLQEAYAA